jgi:hypothetical protein
LPKISNKAKRGKKNPSNGLKASSSLHVGTIMPPRIRRNLSYIDSTYNRTNAGANYLVYSFRVNDLFDPDPLILSGSVSGFKEIMQFYQYYRVIVSSLELKITNNETFSLLWGIFYSTNNYVGSLPNRDAAINTLENGFTSGSKVLAAKGGMDRDSMTCSIPVGEILGNQVTYLAEAGYAGIGLASPSLPLYLHLIVASPGVTNLSNGVTTFLKIGFNTEFYGKLNLQA